MKDNTKKLRELLEGLFNSNRLQQHPEYIGGETVATLSLDDWNYIVDTFNQACTHLTGLLKQVEQLEGENRWRPVAEKLPKRCQPYTISQDVLLVCAGRVYKGNYDEQKGWLIYASYNRQEEYQDKVTHWKPIILPDQARKEKEDAT